MANYIINWPPGSGSNNESADPEEIFMDRQHCFSYTVVDGSGSCLLEWKKSTKDRNIIFLPFSSLNINHQDVNTRKISTKWHV